MTESEAIERIKYRMSTATDIAGKGADGKAYEDMEIAIKALEEIQQYRSIGTVDQFREATEYRNPVTPKLESQYYICPICGSRKNIMLRSKFCSECGQAFKWKEQE